MNTFIQYAPIILVLVLIMALMIGIIYVIRRVLPKKQKTQVEIDQSGIENEPEACGNESEKNTVDNIGDKYGING